MTKPGADANAFSIPGLSGAQCVSTDLDKTYVVRAKGEIKYAEQTRTAQERVAVLQGLGPAAVLATGLNAMCALFENGTVSCNGLADLVGFGQIPDIDLW